VDHPADAERGGLAGERPEKAETQLSPVVLLFVVRLRTDFGALFIGAAMGGEARPQLRNRTTSDANPDVKRPSASRAPAPRPPKAPIPPNCGDKTP
jgi:hypothetical protein